MGRIVSMQSQREPKQVSRLMTRVHIVINDGATKLNFDQTIAQGERNRMRAVDGAELANGGLHVLIDGALGNIEDFADLPRRFSFCHPRQDFAFACGQREATLRRGFFQSGNPIQDTINEHPAAGPRANTAKAYDNREYTR